MIIKTVRFSFLIEKFADIFDTVLVAQLEIVDFDLSLENLFFEIAAPSTQMTTISFLTTYFTSVWIWIFVAGGILLTFFRATLPITRVKSFPITSVMGIGGLMLAILVLIVGYAIFLLGS
jgi:hypothetical protein